MFLISQKSRQFCLFFLLGISSQVLLLNYIRNCCSKCLFKLHLNAGVNSPGALIYKSVSKTHFKTIENNDLHHSSVVD